MCPGIRFRIPLLAVLLLIFFHHAAAQVVSGFSVNGTILRRGDTVRVCLGNTLQFRSVGQGSVNIEWRFQGGSFTSATGIGPFAVTYNATGYDSVFQKITGGNDADSTYCIVRVSNIAPTAAYSWTPEGDCGNNPVQFTNLSTGRRLSYSWDFGDGSISTDTSPSYPFLNAVGISGTHSYPVVLSVTNGLGCTASVTHTVTVKNTPDASIGSADAEVQLSTFNGNATFRKCSNIPSYTFSFTNKSTTTTINTGYTIQWGDGAPDSVFSSWAPGAAISHTFPLGSSTMVVKVSGSNGCTGIKTYTVFLGSTPAGGLASLGNTDVCASDSLRFAINNISANPPGTLYTFLINDGSEAQVFSYPPPATVGHYFATGSCSFSSSSGNSVFNNAFGAYLTIENPCGTTSPSVVPIYVSGKPQAGIFVYPSSTVCTNTNVRIENISTYGAIITPTGGSSSTCTNSGTQVWTISPSTGYTLLGGSLGSLNGSPSNGAMWTTGATNLDVSFTKAGTYTVKIYIYNNRCGMDSTNYTICVRNPPRAAFTMPTSSRCGPGGLKLTNTSPAGACAGDSYSWQVTYLDPLGCGDVQGAPYSYADGSDSTSASPVLQLKAAGKYMIALTVTAMNAGTGCAGSVYTDSFTVTGNPKISIAAPPAICPGGAFQPAVIIDSCYSPGPFSYAWKFAGGTPGSGSLRDPGPVSYSATGSYPISLTLTDNACATVAEANVSLSVVPAPIAYAGKDTAVCSGAEIRLGASPTGSSTTTYRWRPGTGLSDSSVASPILQAAYTGAAADTTLRFVVEASLDGACSSTDEVLVKVRRRPSVSILPAGPAICAGDSIVLTAAGADGYTWSPAVYKSEDAGSRVTVRPGRSTVYAVIGMMTGGCADTTQLAVTVRPRSKALFTAADLTICSNVNLADLITVTKDTTAGTQYSWFDNETTIGSDTDGLFPGWSIAAAGRTDTIRLITTSPFGCAADSMQLVFHTRPAINPHFTKNTAAGCGPLRLYFTNDTGGAETTQFSWDFGNGLHSDMTQPDTIVFAASDYNRDITYFITLKAYNGCDTATWKDSVTVYAGPRAAFTVSSVLGCSPFADTLVNLSQGGISSYYWNFGDGTDLRVSSAADIVHVYHTGTIDTFTIILRASNRCGLHSDSLDVVVTPGSIRPAILAGGNALAGCAPFTTSFNNSSSGAARIAVDFNDGTPVTIVPGNQPVISHQFLQAGVYNVTMRLSNACADTSLARTIRVFAAPVPDFSIAPNPVCTGNAVAATNLSSNGNSYGWSWGDSTVTNSVNSIHAYAHSGTYQVRLTASLVNEYGMVCSVTSDPKEVSVVDLIAARIDTGAAKPCVPYIMSVSARDASDARSVEWTFYDDTRTEGSYKASGTAASYQYNSPGDYRVMLVIQNAAGCSDTSIHSFHVSASPVLGAGSFGTLYTCSTDTTMQLSPAVAYTGTDPLSWSWTINGETAGAGNPFVYRFRLSADDPAPASYAIRVSAVNDEGCEDTADMGTLAIRPLATPHIRISPDSILYQPDYTFGFTDAITRSSPVRYVWDPGDRNGWSYQQQMTHTYGDTGTYHISLRVSDEVTGCIRGDTAQVRIMSVPGYLYVPDAVCPGCTAGELRTFLPKGRGLKEYHLRIFNTWGQMVFETARLDADGAPAEAWNVRWNGQSLQQDAYRWQIEARYINGTEWKGMIYPNHGSPVKSGFITVVK